MIAFLAVANAKPFVYTVNTGAPVIYTNGHGGYANPHGEPSQPLQYIRPTLYANNACRNNLGELVPCAYSSYTGTSVYAYNAVPDVGFLQATSGKFLVTLFQS